MISTLHVPLLGYQDDSRSLGDLARDIFAKDNIRIDTEAMALLLSRLGNDRAVSRREIEKLVLFAGPETV